MNKVKSYAALLAILFLPMIFAGCPSGKFDPVPQPLDFGDVYVGQTASGTALWANNAGVPGTINGMAVNSAPTFTTTSAAPNEVVAAGTNSSAFTFVFAPSAAGQASGNAQIFTAGVRPKNLNLTGNGVYQKRGTAVSVADGDLVQGTALDFKEVPVGTSKTMTFKIKNSDPTNAVTVAVSWKNAGVTVFTANPNGNIPIPANGEVTVTISFTPTAVVDYTNIIEFTDTANGANLAGTIVKGKGIQG